MQTRVLYQWTPWLFTGVNSKAGDGRIAGGCGYALEDSLDVVWGVIAELLPRVRPGLDRPSLIGSSE